MRFLLAFLSIAFLCHPLVFAQSEALKEKERERLRRIIQSSRTMGRHGYGVSTQSKPYLKKKLKDSDVPRLIELANRKKPDAGSRDQVVEDESKREISFGAELGLEVLCAAGLRGAIEAFDKNEFPYLDALEIVEAIAEEKDCDASVNSSAKDSVIALKSRHDDEVKRAIQKAKELKANDDRIQKNGIEQYVGKPSTREERLEVFNRSVKAAGLDGNRTAEQESLYQSMYKAMVERPEAEEPRSNAGTSGQ